MVAHDLERSAGVVRRDHGLLGEERLVRDHPEVFVDGGVIHGEAPRVEVGEPLVVDPAGELDPPVERAGDVLEPVAVGTVADDHDSQLGIEVRRLDQEVDPFRGVEPVDREHEVLRLRSVVGELLRRMR